MPDKVVSLRNTPSSHEVAFSVNTYFFHIDEEKIIGSTTNTILTSIQADGYKNGRVVYSSGTGINIINQGFLGYGFSTYELQNPPKDDNMDLYCVFDRSKRFRVISPRCLADYPDQPYSELRYIVNPTLKDDESKDGNKHALAKEKEELGNLMDKYYHQYQLDGKGIVVDESNIAKYRSRFKALPADAEIVMFWNGNTPGPVTGTLSHIALILHRDSENSAKSYYYIHAEPKD